MPTKPWWITAAVAVLLLILSAQILHAIHGQSLTWDEGDHIFAGYESWKTHDYGLNPEHPPMVKMLATIPLLGLDLQVPRLQGRFFKTEAYLDGRQMLFHNGPQYPARSLVFRVRVAAMIFTLVAALLGLLRRLRDVWRAGWSGRALPLLLRARPCSRMVPTSRPTWLPPALSSRPSIPSGAGTSGRLGSGSWSSG